MVKTPANRIAPTRASDAIRVVQRQAVATQTGRQKGPTDAGSPTDRDNLPRSQRKPATGLDQMPWVPLHRTRFERRQPPHGPVPAQQKGSALVRRTHSPRCSRKDKTGVTRANAPPRSVPYARVQVRLNARNSPPVSRAAALLMRAARVRAFSDRSAIFSRPSTPPMINAYWIAAKPSR